MYLMYMWPRGKHRENSGCLHVRQCTMHKQELILNQGAFQVCMLVELGKAAGKTFMP